jgi:DNA-binding transcriptional ArsR family regulator
MPTPPLKRMAEIAQILCDPTRVALIRSLAKKGPQHVGALAKAINSRPAHACHHLRLMLHARLVSTRRDRRYVIYSLAHPDLADLLKLLEEIADARHSDDRDGS